MNTKVWKYKGVNVFPAPRNSSGFRWETLIGRLRADTKAGMRELISNAPTKTPKNHQIGLRANLRSC